MSIIGANGAGKTTLFNTIAGFVMPSEGSIRYSGRPLGALVLSACTAGHRPHVPNSASHEIDDGVGECAARRRNGRQSRRAVEQTAWAVHIAGLAPMWLDPVARLSPGQQRRLELARALALGPSLLLLDEVMAGMTRDEQGEIRDVLRRLPEFGVAAVAGIEHVIAAIADISDRMIVLDHGRKIAEGMPADVLRTPASSNPISAKSADEGAAAGAKPRRSWSMTSWPGSAA